MKFLASDEQFVEDVFHTVFPTRKECKCPTCHASLPEARSEQKIRIACVLNTMARN